MIHNNPAHDVKNPPGQVKYHTLSNSIEEYVKMEELIQAAKEAKRVLENMLEDDVLYPADTLAALVKLQEVLSKHQ